MQQELFQATTTMRNPRRGTRRFMGSTAAAAVSRWMKKRLKLSNPNEYKGAFNSILFGDRHRKVIDLGRTQRGVLRDLVMAYADNLLQLVMGQIEALDDGELLDRLSVQARSSAMTKYQTELTKQKLWRQEAPLLDKAEKIMLGYRINPDFSQKIKKIAFKANKRGQLQAFRYSMGGGGLGRWLRIGMEDARNILATKKGVEVPFDSMLTASTINRKYQPDDDFPVVSKYVNPAGEDFNPPVRDFEKKRKQLLAYRNTLRGAERDLVTRYAEILSDLFKREEDNFPVQLRHLGELSLTTILVLGKENFQVESNRAAQILQQADKIMLGTKGLRDRLKGRSQPSRSLIKDEYLKGQQRNPAEKDAAHPIEVTRHYRSLPSRGNPGSIAQTIFEQLGGQRFAQMTGAKGFLSDSNSLSFKLPKNKSQANFVLIVLDPNDTYTITFAKYRGDKITTLKEVDMVYADQLREIFERYTGLYTSLGTMSHGSVGRQNPMRDFEKKRKQLLAYRNTLRGAERDLVTAYADILSELFKAEESRFPVQLRHLGELSLTTVLVLGKENFQVESNRAAQILQQADKIMLGTKGLRERLKDRSQPSRSLIKDEYLKGQQRNPASSWAEQVAESKRNFQRELKKPANATKANQLYALALEYYAGFGPDGARLSAQIYLQDEVRHNIGGLRGKAFSDGLDYEIGLMAKRLEQKKTDPRHGYSYTEDYTRNPPARRNPPVREIYETFNGRPATRENSVDAPRGTPARVAQLGRLRLIRTRDGRSWKFPGDRAPFLAADSRGKLHVVGGAYRANPAGESCGEIKLIEYETSKPHLGHTGETIYYHELGEEDGNRPKLVITPEGHVKIVGGAYRIEADGIHN